MSKLADEIRADAEAYGATPEGWGLNLRLQLSTILCVAGREKYEHHSFSEFADIMGMSEAKASNLLHAGRNISLDEIGRICHALDIKVVLRAAKED